MGTSIKKVVNLLLGTGMGAFAEAMALGEGLGLSSKMLFDSLLGQGFEANILKASAIDAVPFENSVEAYERVASSTARTKQVLTFS
jgi:3-hydroxyisobutyrate dehydrogenase-like beta-hydroxyacid dehydrogenase